MYEFITSIRTKTIHYYEMFLLKGQKVADGDDDVVAILDQDLSY